MKRKSENILQSKPDTVFKPRSQWTSDQQTSRPVNWSSIRFEFHWSAGHQQTSGRHGNHCLRDFARSIDTISTSTTVIVMTTNWFILVHWSTGLLVCRCIVNRGLFLTGLLFCWSAGHWSAGALWTRLYHARSILQSVSVYSSCFKNSRYKWILLHMSSCHIRSWCRVDCCFNLY